ncbi:MAG: type II toxin-antitoxin system RelE/ParE family toxin [Thermoleophilia bacterium]|nr:type II toxin-antitoxin system RelE/ParE family toxin [Thermoleophilia bacterium]
MRIRFRTNKLQKWFEDSKTGQRALGQEVARRYIQRIQIIQQTKDVDELRSLPGLRCHSLAGDREGTYAINLTGFDRLIVSIEEGVVTIEEVSKHYGD